MSIYIITICKGWQVRFDIYNLNYFDFIPEFGSQSSCSYLFYCIILLYKEISRIYLSLKYYDMI